MPDKRTQIFCTHEVNVRPHTRNPDIENALLRMVAGGASLSRACAELRVPRTTVLGWPGFRERLSVSREHAAGTLRLAAGRTSGSPHASFGTLHGTAGEIARVEIYWNVELILERLFSRA